MPSRRSNASSDATLSTDSRRTSLRRLSSIASLQHFFSRRRSQHVTEPETVTSSSSALFASSSTVDDTLKASASSSTNNLLHQEQDALTALPAAPPPTHTSNRRSSYICLPDDPIGGMPRSRTFSNLPVPARSRKPPIAMGSSKSHARLPSAFLPNTRLPSPPTSTRKHSHSPLMSIQAKPTTRNQMKRHDTEPLLGFEASHPGSHLPRSTAFKENISLSPVKPLPALNMNNQRRHHHSSSPMHPGQYQPPGAWVSSSSDVGYSLSSSIPSTASYSPSPPPPISKYASHAAVQMVRDYKSSPIRPHYSSSRDRQPTPGTSPLNSLVQMAPVQRWDSQPMLVSRQNDRENPARKDSKHHGEIKQTRLMSARQAPTPPPPKTPLASHATAASKSTKDANNSASAGHVRQSSEQTPPHHEATSTPAIGASSLSQVTTYEPPIYWAGRLSAIADRSRNEELAVLMQPTTSARPTSHLLTPKAQTDKMHTAEAATTRLKRALEELRTRCATADARESLFAFQTQFASMMGVSELRPPKVILHLGDSGLSDAGLEGAGGGMSDGRKASFMERLLGKGKRRSLVLA